MNADTLVVRFSERERRALLLAVFVLALLALVGTGILADYLTQDHERKGSSAH